VIDAEQNTMTYTTQWSPSISLNLEEESQVIIIFASIVEKK
jgi:hypothetical protein